MRMTSVAALAAVITATAAFSTAPADAQGRRYARDNSERITFVDETGRVRTKITVRPRSYLDGGTEVVPGERKFFDYAAPVTYRQASPSAAWDPNGTYRFALPREGDLPGFNPYLPY